VPLLPQFNPYIPEQELSKALAQYKQSPDSFSDKDVETLKNHARYYNVPFATDESRHQGRIGGLISQLGSGFTEGWTTFNVFKDKPRDEYEAIARNIGHLAGFVGYIPAAPFKLLGLKTLAAAAKKAKGRSVPMWAAKLATEKASKIVGPALKGAVIARAGAVGSAATFLSKPLVKDIVEGSFHLGVASSVSSWQGGVDEMMRSFVGGAKTGAVFRGIGNIIKTDSETANKILRGLSSSMYMGLPATAQGATTPEQVYEYLLGAYFGWKEMPYHRRAAGKHLNKMVEQRKTDPEIVKGWEDLDAKTQKYAKEKSIKTFGTREENLAIGYKLAKDQGVDVEQQQEYAENYANEVEARARATAGPMAETDESKEAAEVNKERTAETERGSSTVEGQENLDTGSELVEIPSFSYQTENYVRRTFEDIYEKAPSKSQKIAEIAGDLEQTWESMIERGRVDNVNPSDDMVNYINETYGRKLDYNEAIFWRSLGNRRLKEKRVPLLTWHNGRIDPILEDKSGAGLVPTNLAGNRKALYEEPKIIDKVYQEESGTTNSAYMVLDHAIFKGNRGIEEVPLTDLDKHFRRELQRDPQMKELSESGNWEDRQMFWQAVDAKKAAFNRDNMLNMDAKEGGFYYFGGRGDAARHYYVRYHPRVGNTPEAVNKNLNLIRDLYAAKGIMKNGERISNADFNRMYSRAKGNWMKEYSADDGKELARMGEIFDKAFVSNMFYEVNMNGLQINRAGLSKVLDVGFINDAKDLNKRSQIWLTTGISSNPDFINARLVDSKVPLDREGNYNIKIVEDFDEKLYSDGAIIGHPDVIDAMNADYGLPDKGGTVKSFMVSPNSKHGALLGKYMIHSAPKNIQLWMEKHNVHMIVPRSAAKQLGTRGELRVKDGKPHRTLGRLTWKDGGIALEGTKKETDTYKVHSFDFKGVFSEKNDEHTLRDVTLPKQMQSNLTPYTYSTMQVPEGKERDEIVARNREVIDDMYDTLSGRGFEGDAEMNRKAHLLMADPKKNNYLMGELEKGFEDIGVPTLIEAMKSPGNERFANMAYNKIQRANDSFIATLVEEGEMRFEDADLYRNEVAEQLKVHEKLMQYSPDSLAGIFHKYGRDYRMNSTRNYVVKRLTKPKVGNSFSSRMRPYDIELQNRTDPEGPTSTLKGGLDPVIRDKAAVNVADLMFKRVTKAKKTDRAVFNETDVPVRNNVSGTVHLDNIISGGGIVGRKGVKGAYKVEKVIGDKYKIYEITEPDIISGENLFFLDEGFKDFELYSTVWGGKGKRLEDVWNQFNGEGYGASQEKVREVLRTALTRVPMDSISGSHILNFGGFTGVRGYGVLLHPRTMDALGGADLDGDKAFGFFGSENYGFKKAWKDLYHSNKNEGEGLTSDQLKDKYRETFVHGMDAKGEEFGDAFHQYSPHTRLNISEAAFVGRHSLGPTVVNRATLNAAWSAIRGSKDGFFDYETSMKGLTVTPSEGIRPVPVDDPAKPLMSSLPVKGNTPTMFYTGVGSRDVPKEVRSEMAALARELEKAGYTLRTGDAKGSDAAFRAGARKKEVYKASDANDRARAIAQEVHPAWGNLKSDYVKNLMARNTFQVFGKDLGLPSDFAVVWTKGGEESYTQRTFKTGGTGQAIELASRRGIPVINLSNPNWRTKLDAVLSGKTETELPSYQAEGAIKVRMTPLMDAENMKLFREKARAAISFASDPMDEGGLKNRNVFFDELARHLFKWEVYDPRTGEIIKDLTNSYNNHTIGSFNKNRRTGIVKIMSDINSKLYGKNVMENRRWQFYEVQEALRAGEKIDAFGRNNMLSKLAHSLNGVDYSDGIFNRVNFNKLSEMYQSHEEAVKSDRFRWLKDILGRKSMFVRQGWFTDFIIEHKLNTEEGMSKATNPNLPEWNKVNKALQIRYTKGKDKGRFIFGIMNRNQYMIKNIQEPGYRRYVLNHILKQAEDFVVNDISDIASMNLLKRYGDAIPSKAIVEDIILKVEELKRRSYLMSRKMAGRQSIEDMKLNPEEKQLLRNIRRGLGAEDVPAEQLFSQTEIDNQIVEYKRNKNLTPQESAFMDALLLGSVNRGFHKAIEQIDATLPKEGRSELFEQEYQKLKKFKENTTVSRLGFASNAVDRAVLADYMKEYKTLWNKSSAIDPKVKSTVIGESKVAEKDRPIVDENGNTVEGSILETPEQDKMTQQYLDEVKPFEGLHDGELKGESKEVYYSMKSHLEHYQNKVGKNLQGIVRDVVGKDLNSMNLEDWRTMDRYFKQVRTGTWYQRMFDKVLSKSPEIKKRYHHMFPEAINRDMMRYELELMDVRRPYIDKDGNEQIGPALRATGVVDMLQRGVYSSQENAINIEQSEKKKLKETLRPYVDSIPEGRALYRMAVRIREEAGFGNEQFDYGKYLKDEALKQDWESLKDKEFGIILPDGTKDKMTGRKIVANINDIITEQNKKVHKWLVGDEEKINFYLDMDDGTHAGLVRLKNRFLEDLREAARKNEPMDIELGIDGLNRIAKRILISQVPEAGREEAQKALRENLKIGETGELNPNFYFPHVNFDRGQARKRLLEALENTLDDRSLESRDREIKVQKLIHHYKQMTGDWVSKDEMGDRWDEIGDHLSAIADRKTASKEYIQWYKSEMKVGNQYSRSKDPIPGWDIDPEAYEFYMKNISDTFYRITSQIASRSLINDWSQDFYFRSKKDKKLTNSWRNFLRLYVQDSMGYPSQIPEKVLNDPKMKLKGTPYAWLADSNVLDRVNNIASKLGVRQRNLPKELRGYGYKDLSAWTNLEAKYQLATLLAHPKSSIANFYGGTSMTIINTGWENFRNARKIEYLSNTVNPKWNRMQDVEDWVTSHGVIEEFLRYEADINPQVKGEKWNRFFEDAMAKIRKDPNMDDSTLYELAKKHRLTDKAFQVAASFMRVPERILRRDAFVAHYLQAKEKFGGAITDFNDPFLVEMAKKGVKATQFLYSAPFRPAFARTALGKVLTRFQLWAWNSVRFRNQVLREAEVRGWREGTPEFKRFQRLATHDFFVTGMASIFMYSLFENALPAPWNWFQDTADLLYGDDKERERAFFGAYPYPFQPLQMATPPIARLLPPLFKGMVTDDYTKLSNYYVWTMFPFGRLAKDIAGPGGVIDNPVYGVSKLTGIPYIQFAKHLKSAFKPEEEEEEESA